MKVYLCRWANGDFSICTAKSKQDAIADAVLDEVGGASPEDLHELGAYVGIHLHLTDDGRFQLEDLDERNQETLCDVYPHLFAHVEGQDEMDEEALKEAVRLERGGPGVGAAPVSEEMLRHYLTEFHRNVDDLPEGKWTVDEATALITKHAELVKKGIGDGLRTHVVGDKILKIVDEENIAKRMARNEEYFERLQEEETPRARQKRLREERRLALTDRVKQRAPENE